MTQNDYLLEDQPSELERLQLQSRVWEPAGRRLLNQIGNGEGKRVIDVGCGAMGWLRLLSEWVGPDGQVVGTDIDDSMLQAARTFVKSEGLHNVELVEDDLFASELEPSTFDLVHARFQLAPLGRGPEQMATHLRLVRPGGTIVLEELDPMSWHFIPPAPALFSQAQFGEQIEGLIPILAEAFRKAGGEPNATITQLQLFRDADIDPTLRAEVQALPPGHPYLRLPLEFARGLDEILRTIIDPDDLDRILEQAERELNDPERWGLTFTLIQAWGQADITPG